MTTPAATHNPHDMGADTPRRPTSRQWWRIAHEALALLDVAKPETRREASELIDRLSATNRPAPDSAPF